MHTGINIVCTYNMPPPKIIEAVNVLYRKLKIKNKKTFRQESGFYSKFPGKVADYDSPTPFDTSQLRFVIAINRNESSIDQYATAASY